MYTCKKGFIGSTQIFNKIKGKARGHIEIVFPININPQKYILNQYGLCSGNC